MAWGPYGDLPVLGVQRALSVPDPRRARATRTAVETTPRTPSTRASGSLSGALTLPGPTGPQAVTAGHARMLRPTRGARTAGMCGARALRLRPTIGSATTVMAGRPGGVVGRAGPRSPRRPRRHLRWTMAGTTRTGRTPRPGAAAALPPPSFHSTQEMLDVQEDSLSRDPRATYLWEWGHFCVPVLAFQGTQAGCCHRQGSLLLRGQHTQPLPSELGNKCSPSVARGHTCSRPDSP